MGAMAKTPETQLIEALKTYGPPRLHGVYAGDLISLRQRIRPVGRTLAKMEIRASRSS